LEIVTEAKLLQGEAIAVL